QRVSNGVTSTATVSPSTKSSPVSLDDKKILVGYRVGAGVDFAMTDNVMLRAEYHYSDFGKKKFYRDQFEVNYKSNNFRVGVAYKF
ncbi:MAG: outer membrane beta-barrel protein, partial [Bartonella sp.]|nr:outer membrane beta-barrel protein [Bartonella sp.]